jgi:hypothetical protein
MRILREVIKQMKKQRDLFSKIIVIVIITVFIITSINPSSGITNNNPPYVPYNPRPMSGTTGVASGPWFSWSGGDPDGDAVKYDLYWGKTNPPPMVESNMSGTYYDPYGEWIMFNITIYWKVVAWDEHGAKTEGPLWVFTFAPNYPPFHASEPYPADGANKVPVNASLSWVGSDPNIWDELTYDVYFGLFPNPSLVSYNQKENYFDPYGSGDLPIYEDFYWRIVTRDREGEETIGPNWTFATGVNCTPPVPTINGPTHARVNENHTYTFSTTCEDIVIFQVDWGDGSPTEILNPIPTDDQKAIANHSWDKIGTYNIRARTEDIWGILSDWGQLEVTIPRTKIIIYGLLNLLLVRFLKMEVFLRIMNL